MKMLKKIHNKLIKIVGPNIIPTINIPIESLTILRPTFIYSILKKIPIVFKIYFIEFFILSSIHIFGFISNIFNILYKIEVILKKPEHSITRQHILKKYSFHLSL